MDRNDDLNGDQMGRTPFPVKPYSNKPRCLADGTIPWMAGHIEWVATETIKIAETSLRRHSRRQRRLLKKAIKKYGFVVPLLVDQDLTVVLGEARLEAARDLEMDKVPVIRISHLTDREITALKLADNKIAELAEWDWDAVARELERLGEASFDIELTGFTVTEADLVIARHLPKPHDVTLDDCPPGQPGPSVAQPGDVFLMDLHRAICGDCREAGVLAKLMNGLLASASFCDAPYNLEIPNNVSGLGKIKHGQFAMASGEMSDEEFFDFLVAYLVALVRVSGPGAVHFSCMDWRSLDILIRAIRQVGGIILNICTWAKTCAGMGAFYRSQTEFVVVFKIGDVRHRNNVELGANGRNRSNLWTYEGANSINPARRKELALHPTVKPARMVADAILDCTQRGDIVYDAFLGSGTTLIAAEETGRVCYGCEISGAYMDVIIRRWQEFTGGEAIHEATGLSFNQLAARRLGPKLLPPPAVRTGEG